MIKYQFGLTPMTMSGTQFRVQTTLNGMCLNANCRVHIWYTGMVNTTGTMVFDIDFVN